MEEQISAIKAGSSITVGNARDLVSNVIARGGYGMKKGNRFTSITSAEVIADQVGDSPTAEQIQALALELDDMYAWWTNGGHGLSNPAKSPSVISGLKQYREHLANLRLNAVSNSGGTHASNVLVGRANVVPSILPKPITPASLSAVRRDGDVSAGRADGSSDAQ